MYITFFIFYKFALMNLNVFLAKRVGSKVESSGRLGRTGTVISVVSVAVSVAVIIIASAVSNGFRDEITYKARGYSGDIVLSVAGSDIVNESSPVPDSLHFLGEVAQLPFVESLRGVSYKHGIIKTDGEIEGVLFKGVDSLYNLDFYGNYLVEGELPELSGRGASNDILMSRHLADAMQYRVGDKVTAYFIGDQVRVRRFNLTGIFDAHLEQFEKSLALVDIRHINRLNGWDNEVSGYEVFLNVPSERRHVEEIQNLYYMNASEDEPSIFTVPLEDKYYVLFDWLNLLDLNVVVILALMIAVAGFNMVSGLLILLFEKISFIGLLKALGMATWGVSKVFLTKSAMIVLQGMVYGNAVALAFCLLQKHFAIIKLDPANYFVSAVPISFDPGSLLLMNAIAFVAINVIMLLPCLFISKINPAATMRVK